MILVQLAARDAALSGVFAADFGQSGAKGDAESKGRLRRRRLRIGNRGDQPAAGESRVRRQAERLAQSAAPRSMVSSGARPETLKTPRSGVRRHSSAIAAARGSASRGGSPATCSTSQRSGISSCVRRRRRRASRSGMIFSFAGPCPFDAGRQHRIICVLCCFRHMRFYSIAVRFFCSLFRRRWLRRAK